MCLGSGAPAGRRFFYCIFPALETPGYCQTPLWGVRQTAILQEGLYLPFEDVLFFWQSSQRP